MRLTNYQTVDVHSMILIGEMIFTMIKWADNYCDQKNGELDENPFLSACWRKYENNEYQVKVELVTNWKEELKNPSWHPFKMIQAII